MDHQAYYEKFDLHWLLVRGASLERWRQMQAWCKEFAPDHWISGVISTSKEMRRAEIIFANEEDRAMFLLAWT